DAAENVAPKEILVEIKIDDGFLPGQLIDYMRWSGQDHLGIREVLVLTAYPLKREDRAIVDSRSAFARHMLLSEYASILAKKGDGIYAPLLVEYLTELGYAM